MKLTGWIAGLLLLVAAGWGLAQERTPEGDPELQRITDADQANRTGLFTDGKAPSREQWQRLPDSLLFVYNVPVR